MVHHLKSPYQKRIRIATYQKQYRFKFVSILSLLIVLFVLAALLLWPDSIAARGLSGASELQSANGEPIPYVLLPIDAADVELQTFTADFFLSTDDAGALVADVQLLFRVHNLSDSSTTLFLGVAPNGQNFEPGAALSNPPAVDADGQPLSLQQADNSSWRTQIQLAPDGRSDVTLRYRLDYRSARLPQLNYPIDWLDEWRGEQSLRVSIALPQTIAPESWVRIEPQGWNYALSSNPQQPDIKWLFEAQLPTDAFVFQIISPNVWAQMAALTAQTAEPATALSAYSQLGELYRQLYQDPTINDISPTDETIRERFYAAALAAYTSGQEIASVNGQAVEAARLQASLAALYRSRVVDPDGQSNEYYAALMQDEARAALAALPADDGRRAELVRWRSEGLLVRLEALQRAGKWTEALVVLDELESLSGSVSNSLLSEERLAADRRAIRLQQALELLQSNNQDAALALAGEELTNQALQPLPEAQTLFEGWRITTTIGTDRTEIELLGQPVPRRAAAAQESLQSILNGWQTSSIPDQAASLETVAVADSTTPNLHLSITLADVRQSDSLAQLTPTDANWALLRSLLFQLNPTIRQSTSTIWEEVELAQPLDLRTAGDHWSAMATSLEQQAEQYTAEATQSGESDTEQAIQAQIRAVNHRNAARAWRALAQNSWATVTLTSAAQNADTGALRHTRSWVADVTTPPQQLMLSAQFIAPVRLLGAIVLLLFGLFMLSGFLWWLL